MPAGPPPLLEGQTARVGAGAPPAATVSDATSDGSRKVASKQAKETGTASRRTPAKKAGAAKKTATGRKTATNETAAPAKKGSRTPVNASALGLPTDAGEIASYMVNTYTGVGPKSVQSLIEKFGASRVFEALETKRDAVRDLMGAARGDRLLEAWTKDVEARRSGSATSAAQPTQATDRGANADEDVVKGAAKKSRTRRGGRRSRGGQTAGK
jgi:hypothetical protein